MENEIKNLEAIKKAFSNDESSLLASDIRLNTNNGIFYPVGKIGDCIPIAYQSEEIADAFISHLCQIAQEGCDFEHQPKMKIGEGLKGCTALVYPSSTSVIYPCEENTIVLPLPEMETQNTQGACRCISEIGEQTATAAARIVIIGDAAELTGENPSQAIALLNTLAEEQGIMIFAFFKVSEKRGKINKYLFNHAYNLCILEEIVITLPDEGIYKTFTFQYGHPNSKIIVYGIKEGAIVIPPKVSDMLLMKVCGDMFIKNQPPITKERLTNVIWGLLEAQYKKNSIQNKINFAVENEIFLQSGDGNKAYITLAAEPDEKLKAKRKPNYKGNVALTALTDPSKTTHHKAKRKPLLRMGDFRILAPAKEKDICLKHFATSLIEAVISKKDILNISIKTEHRNTLILLLADIDTTELIKNRLEDSVKKCRFDIVYLGANMTGEEMLSAYKEYVNKMQPDFCFILNSNRIACDDEKLSIQQLKVEMEKFSRNKGVATIAQTGNLAIKEIFETDEKCIWEIAPLIDAQRLQEICNSKIEIPFIYQFSAREGDVSLLCNFWSNIKLASTKEYKRAFYLGTFFKCCRTPCSDIVDCTGKAVTNSVIYQAEKNGFINVDYVGTGPQKTYKDSVITFIGK
jgi:hypothetical protein